MAHEKTIGWPTGKAREGVDTRTKDLTGAGAVIPESGVPAVKRGNVEDVYRMVSTPIVVNDEIVGYHLEILSLEKPEVDTRSTEEIIKALLRLADKADALWAKQEKLVEMAQVSQRKLKEQDLFPGSRTKEIAAMVAKTKKKKPTQKGVGQVDVDGKTMEVPTA